MFGEACEPEELCFSLVSSANDVDGVGLLDVF